ncbi:hypothetical protein [Rhodococcus qingshengii]|uniref:hypothetical protein n=1 Tax=Rhodococcus qingshengii TaxID=334542 RepID=UPI00211EE5FC|nr:hypothetical protein [Rhodococcus qingshengii]
MSSCALRSIFDGTAPHLNQWPHGEGIGWAFNIYIIVLCLNTGKPIVSFTTSSNEAPAAASAVAIGLMTEFESDLIRSRTKAAVAAAAAASKMKCRLAYS